MDPKAQFCRTNFFLSVFSPRLNGNNGRKARLNRNVNTEKKRSQMKSNFVEMEPKMEEELFVEIVVIKTVRSVMNLTIEKGIIKRETKHSSMSVAFPGKRCNCLPTKQLIRVAFRFQLVSMSLDTHQM